MARASYAETLLGGLPAEYRRTFRAVFDYILTGLRVGRIEDGKRVENMQWYALQATTPGVANTPFTIAHGLGVAPYSLLPVLPLDAAGGQLVRLTVTQAADAHRIYLSSPDTDAPITVLIEG